MFTAKRKILYALESDVHHGCRRKKILHTLESDVRNSHLWNRLKAKQR